jgi:DNA-binding transcriptional LysR family regulator
MDKFQEMRVFVTVVTAGSFVGAANDLAISRTATSRYVADLEERLGIRLLQRTTRKLSLTEEGSVFYARCKELLSEIDEAEAEVTSRKGTAKGQLKISAPLSFGLLHLGHLWPEFMAKHAAVTLDVVLTDRTVDLIEEGFDLAIRIARLPSSSFISRTLGSTRMVLCASPRYIKRRGSPRKPSDLALHDVIAYSHFAAGDEWGFAGPNGTSSVRVQPRMRTNSGDTCRIAALQGCGIVLQPTFLIGDDLRNGALVELMPDYRSIELGIHVVYPSRRHVSPKVRLLIDFLVKAFKKPHWPE